MVVLYKKKEAQLKVLVLVGSLFVFSVIKHFRVKSFKFPQVEQMAHCSVIHTEPPSVTLGRGMVGVVGWGDRLPGLGGPGNCPAVTLQPLAPKGAVTLSVV